METEKTEVTPEQAALCLVQLASERYGEVEDDFRGLVADPFLVERELLFLKLCTVYFGIEFADWEQGRKVAVGEKLTGAVGQVVPSMYPKQVVDGLSLDEFMRTLEGRFEQYWEACQRPHESGPGWQISKTLAEICNEGDWEELVLQLMPGIVLYMEVLDAVCDLAKGMTVRG